MSNVALAIEVGVILLILVGFPWALVFLGSTKNGPSEATFWILTVLFASLWLALMTIYIAADLASVVHDMKEKGQCLDCGYDLRGSPGGECPECGGAAIGRVDVNRPFR